MKIRYGFVSNSSSSSYMVITSKSNFYEVVDRTKMKPEGYKEILEHIIQPTKKINGVEMVSFWLHWESGEHYYSNNCSFNEDANNELRGIIGEDCLEGFNEFIRRMLVLFEKDRCAFYERIDQ